MGNAIVTCEILCTPDSGQRKSSRGPRQRDQPIPICMPPHPTLAPPHRITLYSINNVYPTLRVLYVLPLPPARWILARTLQQPKQAATPSGDRHGTGPWFLSGALGPQRF